MAAVASDDVPEVLQAPDHALEGPPASAFVRGMALDVALHGQPTYRPWDATEAAKPRGVAPRLFFDEIVTLPKVTA